MIVDGYRDVLTRGTYMGESGTSYGWGKLDAYGDYSAVTHGHLQGYTERVRLEILVPARLGRSMDDDLLLYRTDNADWIVPTDCGPLNLGPGIGGSEAVEYGFARVVA